MNRLANLPLSLRQQLISLHRRVRRLLFLRRAALLVLALTTLFAAAFFADLAFGLPGLWLRFLVAAMTIVLVAGGVFAGLLPFTRAVEPEALAALIERKYPDLAERLTSAVNLTARGSQANGSLALRDLLVAEADTASQQLDIGTALSPQASRRTAALAGFALAIVALPALFSTPYRDFSERLLFAWFRPVGDFMIEAHPGDGAFAIGRPVAISAELLPRYRHAAPPPHALLVYRHADAGWQTLEMPRDGDRYTCTIPGPASDLTYRIEAGSSASNTFRLHAVEPVQLLADSPYVTLTPPDYVTASVQRLNRPDEVQAVEFSRLRFDFHFTRPAVAGAVLIEQPNETGGAAEWRFPLQWSTAEQAHFEIPALPAGVYAVRLRVEAEHQIATEEKIAALHIVRDRAPVFTTPPLPANTPLSAGPLSVPSDDTLILKFAVEDAEGLGPIELEYQVNDAPPQIAKVADGKGEKVVSGEHRLRLRGKVATGDTLRYRVKASDNRRVAKAAHPGIADQRVPETDLLPQSTYSPDAPSGDSWVSLAIEDSAEALAKQNIASDRDRMRQRIDAIRTKVMAERNQLEKFRRDTFHQPITGVPQEKHLGAIRAMNRAVHADLTLFAHQTADHELLAALSMLAEEIAETEIQQAGAALEQVQKKRADADPRDRQVVAADNALASAVKRLDQLAERNQQLADYRLDQLRLDQLADEQELLAKRAAELAALDPAENPEAAKELAKLRAEQERLAAELARLTQQSKLFQQALRQAQAEQARQLGQQASDLAQQQAKIAAAMHDTLKRQLADALAALAEKQEILAKKVTALRQHSAAAAKEKPIAPLNPAPAHKAAELLRALEIDKTLLEQTASENELERFAADLLGPGPAGWSPRQPVESLVLTQAALRKQLEQLGNDLARIPIDELAKQLAALADQQRRLADHLGKLALPEDGSRARVQNAARLAREAVSQLERADALAAFTQMEQTHTALQQLAKTLPGTDDYHRTLAAELGRLHALQQKVADGASSAKELENRADRAKRLDELARQQEEIVRGVEALTVSPTHEPLRKRLLASLDRIADDLRQGRLEKLGELRQMPAALEQFKGILLGLIHTDGAEPEGSPSAHATAARALAVEQRMLREELEKMLAGDVPAEFADKMKQPDIDAERAKHVDGQKQLADETARLMQELKDLADKMKSKAADDALKFAQQAGEAMEKAAGDEGNPKASEDAASEAAAMLKKTSAKADELAKSLSDDKLPFDFERAEMAKTGADLMEGQAKTEQASQELNDANSQGAQEMMQQAANALNQAAQQAAKQLAQAERKGPPAADSTMLNRAADNGPGSHLPPEDLEEFTKRPWGELPGTLRTQIIQDLRARFGDDYARMVQQYFERIAYE